MKTSPGASFVAEVRIQPTDKAFAKKVYKRVSVSVDYLEKLLPDYVDGKLINGFFK